MLKTILAALALAIPAGAAAQPKYPSRTIEVVVPYAPGGGTDNLMRMITGIIDENKWSPVPINVNNRAGGSGTVGYSYLISKKGDSNVVAGATPMASNIEATSLQESSFQLFALSCSTNASMAALYLACASFESSAATSLQTSALREEM